MQDQTKTKNSVERVQPSCKIQCQLDDNFESQFSSSILYEVSLKRTPGKIFNNHTTDITWHANLTTICLYVQFCVAQHSPYKL